MPVAIDSFGLTDQGKVREKNEDNFLIVDILRSVDIRHSSLSPSVQLSLRSITIRARDR